MPIVSSSWGGQIHLTLHYCPLLVWVVVHFNLKSVSHLFLGARIHWFKCSIWNRTELQPNFTYRSARGPFPGGIAHPYWVPYLDGCVRLEQTPAGVSVSCKYITGRTLHCWVYFKALAWNNNVCLHILDEFFAEVECLQLTRLNTLIPKWLCDSGSILGSQKLWNCSYTWWEFGSASHCPGWG